MSRSAGRGRETEADEVAELDFESPKVDRVGIPRRKILSSGRRRNPVEAIMVTPSPFAMDDDEAVVASIYKTARD